MMPLDRPPSTDAPPPAASANPAAVEPKSLPSLKRMFDDWVSLTQDARNEALVDQDYYDGKQWTAAERRVLQSRKQPDNVFNRVRPAINGTLGVIKQGASDPRAFPRNPDDEDSADVASKTLRYIAESGRFVSVKLDVTKDYMVLGTGAVVVEVDGDGQVIPRRIRWEEFFHDPRSRERDFSDARYMGIAKWMYADDVSAAYPDAEVEGALSGAPMGLDQSLQDRPESGTSPWADGRRRRLLVCEVYYREGSDWFRCVFHGSKVLEQGPSPYLDHKGRPVCAIEAQSCYVDRDNNRYGLVRDMRGPQDEINKRRSKLLHIINTRQVQETQIGVMSALDPDEVRKEAARPDGVLPSGVQIVQTSDMAQGQANLLAEAKSEIERMGPNPAILGRQGEDQSGRATLVRQQAGLTEQAIIFGGIEEWELRVYRQMWARAKQYWTGPDYVRVTDDQNSPQFVGINQPVMGPPQQVLTYDEATGQQGYTLQPTILGYKNKLAEMDVDIILDTTPDTANIQQEQFQALVDLARSGVPIPPQVLLEASSIPNKREIIEKLQKLSEAPDPKAQLGAQAAQAGIAKTEAQAQEHHAKAIKTLADAHVAVNGPGQPAAPEQAPSGPMDDAERIANLGKTIAQGQAAHSQAVLNISKAGNALEPPPGPEPGWGGQP